VLAPACWAAESPGQLVEKAREARRAAEAELARARARHVAEGKALTAQLREAYDALDGAQAGDRAARESLARLREVAGDPEREAAAVRRATGALIADATDAAGATLGRDASAAELEQQTWAAVDGKLSAVGAALAVSVGPEPVFGRDGAEHSVPVLRLGGFAAYACGEDADTLGLLEVALDDRLLVVGPYLDARHARSLRAVAGGSAGLLPVDVDGTLRQRSPTEPWSVRGWLAAGGMFVYPILGVALLGVALIAERLLYLLRTGRSPTLIRATLGFMDSGDLASARDMVAARRTPTQRVALAGINAFGKPDEEKEAAMESALLAEAPKLERSLSLLAALAAVAPLLGLLGTVSGMIATFNTISAAGTGNPRLLSGGISEALITTQLGLMVAIPLLLVYAWLRRWVERREAMLEYDAIRISAIRRDEREDG